MDIVSALSMCRDYARLGGGVQAQLEELVENEIELVDCNPNALKLILRFLEDNVGDLDDDLGWTEAISEYLEGLK